MSGAKPVTLGQGYSTIASIPEAQGSWSLPLLHERISSAHTPIETAAAQLRQVCQRLTIRPVSLWDAEYGCAPFREKTADIACDRLMRLRFNRVLYGAPATYTRIGRPRKHGDKFKLNDPTSWWQPDEEQSVEDAKWGQLRLQVWHELHLRQAAQQVLSLIRVERLGASTTIPPLKP